MKRNDNYILCQIEDEYVLNATQSAKKLPCKVTMSESGAMIWNLLKSHKTLDQLVTAVTGEYDVAREIAEKDIRDFLVQMGRLELLTVS